MSEEMKPFNHQSIDARDWAKEFTRLYEENLYKHNHLWIDESLMQGWFANAIMAGMDEQARRTRPEPRQGMEVNEVGFILFKLMSGYEEELAREEWTAKHSPSTAKKLAAEYATTILSRFTLPAEVRWPEIDKIRAIINDGLWIDRLDIKVIAKQVLDLCKQALEEARKR